MKNDSEGRQSVRRQPILLIIFHDIIASKVIYFTVSNTLGLTIFFRKNCIRKCYYVYII